MQNAAAFCTPSASVASNLHFKKLFSFPPAPFELGSTTPSYSLCMTATLVHRNRSTTPSSGEPLFFGPMGFYRLHCAQLAGELLYLVFAHLTQSLKADLDREGLTAVIRPNK